MINEKKRTLTYLEIDLEYYNPKILSLVDFLYVNLFFVK